MAWGTGEQWGLFGALRGHLTKDTGARSCKGLRGNDPETVLGGVEEIELGVCGPGK